MSPAPTPDPTLTARTLDVLEVWAKIVGALVILWGFAEKIGKPYFAWRKEHQSRVLRDVLKEELACISELREARDEDRAVLTGLTLEMGEMYTLVRDMHELQEDQVNLLTAMGFNSGDRRADVAAMKQTIERIDDARRARRRSAKDSGGKEG